MQSVEELAQAIDQLNPTERQALMDKLALLIKPSDTDGADARINAMQEAMSDELFLADLREVTDDFRYADFEEAFA